MPRRRRRKGRYVDVGDAVDDIVRASLGKIRVRSRHGIGPPSPPADNAGRDGEMKPMLNGVPVR